MKSKIEIKNVKTNKGSYSLIKPNQRRFIIKNLNNKNALEDFLFKTVKPRYVRDMFEDLNHGFHLLVDFPNKEVLNVGCGEGTEPIFFAKYGAKNVTAMDFNPDRLKILNARSKYLGLDKKITTIQGDFTKAKIQPESFDIITMIGVFEYLAKKNAKKEYPIYLKKIRNTLKEKGKFVMAIENRFNPLFFLGYPDHHGLPFTMLIPKFLANIITYIIKGKPYTHYIYSDKGYRRLFTKAGFKNIEIYPVLFAYQDPRFIIKSSKIYRFMLSKYGFNIILEMGAKLLSLLPNPVLNKLVPSYVIIGEK